MAANQSITPAPAGQSQNIPALGDAEQEDSANQENELFLLAEKYGWSKATLLSERIIRSGSGCLKQLRAFCNMLAAEANHPVEFAWLMQHPLDWRDKNLRWRIIGMELLSHSGMSNQELAERLDACPIIICPYSEKTWVKAVTTNNHCKKFISKVRKWVKRPGKNSKSIPLEHFA